MRGETGHGTIGLRIQARLAWWRLRRVAANTVDGSYPHGGAIHQGSMSRIHVRMSATGRAPQLSEAAPAADHAWSGARASDH